MSSEQILPTNQNTIQTTNDSISKQSIKKSIEKLLIYIKPNIINVIITFVTFLILLLFTQKLGVTLLISIAIYFIAAIFTQQISKGKFSDKITSYFQNNNNKIPSIIETTSSKTVLIQQSNNLIAFALLKIEWSTQDLPLNAIWDFLQEEGIQIQDCKEGCFLVIRKKLPLKKAKGLEEQAKELIKILERTILLVRKKFEIEYNDFHLKLVKGQNNIIDILRLGLLVHNFRTSPELSIEEIETLRESNFSIQDECETQNEL